MVTDEEIAVLVRSAGPTAALDAVVMHYAPQLAGQQRTSVAVNAAAGTDFRYVRDGDVITEDAARTLRDAFEARRAEADVARSLDNAYRARRGEPPR